VFGATAGVEVVAVPWEVQQQVCLVVQGVLGYYQVLQEHLHIIPVVAEAAVIIVQHHPSLEVQVGPAEGQLDRYQELLIRVLRIPVVVEGVEATEVLGYF